ncbi:NUDIX hydrolase N-terminal domain-containing protein [Phytomonospora sp. NPDC050363]|uniref:NUDIX hydrolase N-terminal domain-containing protein n=1 Tax=Phytomonospora sp. NPDC050363 TaxID=3155642 RepID=UPI0033F9E38B
MRYDRASTSTVLRICALVQFLRAQAVNGLHYFPDAVDERRFTALRRLAAELSARIDTRAADEIEAEFGTDAGPQTPRLGVVLLVTRADGARLLVPTAPGAVGLPRDLVAVDGHPLDTLKRMMADLRLTPVAEPVLVGICDGMTAGELGRHTLHLAFELSDDASRAVSSRGSWSTDANTPLDALTDRVLNPDGAATETSGPIDVPSEVLSICERVRALAVEGLSSHDSFNVERFTRITSVIDETVAPAGRNELTLPRTAVDTAQNTPTVGAETLVVDGRGRILLLQRPDTGEWAMPGGACEVGESADATAVRETEEETGLKVTVDRLVGVFDNRRVGAGGAAIRMIAVYAARLVDPDAQAVTTAEARAVAWFDPDQIAALNLFHGHRRKIDAALSALRNGEVNVI